MKESIEVTLLGKTFSFRSEFDQQFMSETAKFVNGKIQEVITTTGTVTTEKIAILAAMNIAGDYLKLKRENETVKGAVRKTADKILKTINSLL